MFLKPVVGRGQRDTKGKKISENDCLQKWGDTDFSIPPG